MLLATMAEPELPAVAELPSSLSTSALVMVRAFCVPWRDLYLAAISPKLSEAVVWSTEPMKTDGPRSLISRPEVRAAVLIIRGLTGEAPVRTRVEFPSVLCTPLLTGLRSLMPARPLSLMPAVGAGAAKVAVGVDNVPPPLVPMNPELVSGGKLFRLLGSPRLVPAVPARTPLGCWTAGTPVYPEGEMSGPDATCPDT